MKPTSRDLWVPFAFSVVLSAIAVVTFIATGNSGAWIPAFVCFLPMAFYFVALSNQLTRGRIQALEARLQVLEAASARASEDKPGP